MMLKQAAKTVPWVKEGELIGYALWDSFDELLCQLSVGYIETALQKLSLHIARIGGEPGRIRFGRLHPGVAVVPPGRQHPLSYIGWFFPPGGSPLEEEHEASLAPPLREAPPRFQWGSAYKGETFRCAYDDAAAILQAVHECGIDEPSDFAPAVIAKTAAVSTVLRELAEALESGDPQNLSGVLDAAARHYGADGTRLLRAGSMGWLRALGHPTER